MRLERIRAEICNSWEGEGTLLESRDVSVSGCIYIERTHHGRVPRRRRMGLEAKWSSR